MFLPPALFLFRALTLQLGHQAVDLLLGLILSCLQGRKLFAVALDILQQLVDQVGSLVDLTLQLHLLGPQGGLFGFQLGLVGLIFRLDFFGVLPGSDVFILQPPVALHDLTDIVHGSEQLAQIVRIQHQGKQAIVSVFLHGADTGAVALKLLFLQRPGGFHFLGLVLDHLVVERDLLLVQLHLLQRIYVAVVQSQLPFQNAGVLGLQLVHNGLLGGLFFRDPVALFFQRVDLALGNCLGLNGHGAKDQAQHSHHAQNQREYGFCFLFHIFSFAVSVQRRLLSSRRRSCRRSRPPGRYGCR